jgi:hypothetical protein
MRSAMLFQITLDASIELPYAERPPEMEWQWLTT